MTTVLLKVLCFECDFYSYKIVEKCFVNIILIYLICNEFELYFNITFF
jgi:hypothetical protein